MRLRSCVKLCVMCDGDNGLCALKHAAKRLAMIGLLCLALGLAGCGDPAEGIYDTAQFEEVQNNKPHARKLYEEIVRDHPDSPVAVKAKERLATMSTKSSN